jgi:myo-inositol 2-dehydrogenase/D-chiro-inositol 1-dehydrogenase/scyllo-inositol 2-dehydrogenase (NAD+)
VTDKVGLGIIGCGWGARDLYAPVFKHLANGRLVACTDASRDSAEGFRVLSGAERVAGDLDDLLSDPAIDAVMVLTPPHVHAEQVAAIARARKHVYCEKPMAKTVEQAQAMVDACRENGIILQVGFMKRFNPSFLAAKQAIDDGRLGDLFEMRAVWDNARVGAGKATNYRHLLIAGGGYLQEDGSHPIDVCRWFLGEVAEVSAEVLRVASDRFENDDVALVMMRHRNHALSSLHITMLTHRTGMESYEVFGTHGTLLMRWHYHSMHSLEPAEVRLYEHSTRTTDLTLSTSWDPEHEYIANWQYLNELRHFCDCVLEGREPGVTGEDGKATVEIVNAAYVSALEHRKVPLPLDHSPEFEALFADPGAHSPWDLGDQAWGSRY